MGGVSLYLQDVVMFPCDWLTGHVRQRFFTRAGNGIHRIQNGVYYRGKLKKKRNETPFNGRRYIVNESSSILASMSEDKTPVLTEPAPISMKKRKSEPLTVVK